MDLWDAYFSKPTIAHRNRLVEHYYPFVLKIANNKLKRFPRRLGYTRDSLASWGAEGLMQAIERFNPELGVPFEKYASRRIVGAILDGVRADGWRTRQEQKTGAPTTDTLAEMGHVCPPVDDTHVWRRLELRDEVKVALAGLSTRDRLLLLLHFSEGLSTYAVGPALGMSQANASILIIWQP